MAAIAEKLAAGRLDPALKGRFYSRLDPAAGGASASGVATAGTITLS